MNIAVINLKDIIKYLIYFVLIIIVITVGIKILNKEEFEETLEKAESISFKSLKNSSFLYCLKREVPMITMYDENEEEKIEKFSQKIINTEIALINSLEKKEEINNPSFEDIEEKFEEIQEKKEEYNEEQNLEDVPNTADTKVITDHNIDAKYTNTLGGNVKINNQTKYNIDDITGKYEIKNKNKVIIYHSHTCESYTSSEKYKYEMTGTYRTTDLNYTVSRVGDELEKYLKEYGKTVIHDKTYHDYPAYNGSYERSLTTMEKIIEKNKDAEIMIDLHRDAVRKLKYLWTNCKNRR